MLALVVLAFIGLGFRLVDLQVWRHDELAALAEKSAQEEIPQPARRGDILDANGNVLATSVPVETVCADPSLLGIQQAVVARALAPLLRVNEADLFQRLQPRICKNQAGETVTNQYVVLQHKVSEETWQKIHSTMTDLPLAGDESKMSKADRARFVDFAADLRRYAIFAEPDQLRVYPNGALAAHVLGFVGTKETEQSYHDAFRPRRHREILQFKIERRAGLARDGRGQPGSRAGSAARPGRFAARRLDGRSDD